MEYHAHYNERRSDNLINSTINSKFLDDFFTKTVFRLIAGYKNTSCKRKHKRRQLTEKSVTNSKMRIQIKGFRKRQIVLHHSDDKTADKVYYRDENTGLHVS